ncbi:MAG: methyltransferase domain-containing protein [Nitrospiraceae bacterium]
MVKLRILDLLVCPIDKTPLELVEWESIPLKLSKDDIARIECRGLDPSKFSKEITTGVLVNRALKTIYPIHAGIPRMLVFPTDVARKFSQQHAHRIARELPGFSTPQELGMPGEQTVLRTFSSEWVNHGWDEQSYWGVRPAALYESMKYLLDLPNRSVKEKLVLEVGIGVGGIADYMTREQECELVGVDLSYAVDPAYMHFGANVFLHIVQASAFHLPFRENSFDLVYSQGVLHHTFSTKTAFDRICKLPKHGGRLYVWLYNDNTDQLQLHRRVIPLMEKVIRPLCWRLPETLQTLTLLPIVLLYLAHQNLYKKRIGSNYVSIGYRGALHAARDRFTPRYAHHHTEAEVSNWFRQAEYTEIQCASKRSFPDIPVVKAMALATVVDGVRG